MFDPVSTDAGFVSGEHQMLKFWTARAVFDALRQKNAGKPHWSFLDGPITANNPMGVHHAWGRTYKDCYQRYFAMTGHELRYQNGFDCQGLWVEVEVEKEMKLGSKRSVESFGIDQFVHECKKRVLKFAARQTEQSIRLGYWMDWDNPLMLRKLSAGIGQVEPVTITTPSGKEVSGPAEEIVAKLGNREWGGSYFTFSTENNETIWTFLKKCFTRGKIYKGHDVMPWSGSGGSAYSQMEVAEGRKLTVHKSVFVRFPLKGRENEFLLVWTTTPWTLTSNVAAAVNPQLDYVKVQAKRDNAVYYFAKENLDFPRLAREFKEGFGRPEWSWPKGIGKLKTIAQIFKEQGGFEVLETLKGEALLGLEYNGPFDDLPVQSLPGGYPENEELGQATGQSCHRVVDGGRDSEGNQLVVGGEGTGIVHIAPGCGDVDHVLGRTLGLVAIAPLGEDGRFGPGFGPFTGKEAIDKQTAELVFEKLKEKGLLVNVEEYPHIYPHCWRTGEELVFRLVDEWFIKMDWREEIKAVTREIKWLPESINGGELELQWLSNMRDWMISKKRFWGLALPIWVDDVSGDFEVMGSLAELKERALNGGEGWDDFVGHTPHRPWIDKVKIKNPKTGNLMTRIGDVGNPWLDAGIVPFSTMFYNSNKEAWREWYPADLVTECFPGQFRNWFYSMLALGTMMRYDETEDPVEKRPFKTLLGHRLVTDELGKPMHKSDGSAIWFEEAAEQLGVDTLRWMYLAQNPAVDLKFGLRHPAERVTLSTPDGDIHETLEGLPTCKVTSTPADEIRRQVLIPLWNSYAFFVNYAREDQINPALLGPNAAQVPVAERPEIDRWLLANLQSLITTARTEMENYNAPGFLREANRFIDDLSNWYIRRNRRRFWRARDTGDRDKLAAYQTLYTVLVTLSRLLAPVVPFLAERMYQNLVTKPFPDEPDFSVHLAPYPEHDPALLDPALSLRMELAQRVVNLGHGLREQSGYRVRQPLPELRFACRTPDEKSAVAALADVIADELNVKLITPSDNLDDIVHYTYKPNLKTLGPKHGKLLGKIGQQLTNTDLAEQFAPLRRGEPVTITIDGTNVKLQPEDVLVSTQQAAAWASADDHGLQVAMSTVLTPELVREGLARDFVRQVQQLRKDAQLAIADHIKIFYFTTDSTLQQTVAEWSDYVRKETQADALTCESQPGTQAKSVLVGESELPVWIEKV